MRKRLITPVPQDARVDHDHRLDLSTTALVEVTSEEKDHPVESALILGEAKGWRAAEPGPQTIRLIFDRPQKLQRISLVFEDKETRRTQRICAAMVFGTNRHVARDSAPAVGFPVHPTRPPRSKNIASNSRLSLCLS